jgi:AraC-like DNA-binding protein
VGEPLPNRALRLVRHRRSRLQSSLFRTYAIDRHRRFAVWRESQSVFLDSRLVDGDAAEDFTGDIESYLLDDIMLTRAVAGRQKYDRPSAKIARDGLDHYMIQVFLQGRTEVDMRRRAVSSEPGRPIAFDLGDVLDSVNSDFDILCVTIPRARLAPLLRRPDSLQAVMPQRDGAAGRLLADYLHSLYLVAPSLTPLEASTATRVLLELSGAAFNGAMGDGAIQAREHAQLLKAMRFIRENLAAADLSPESVALGVGLSRTVLYRLFENFGGVAAFVRELRLRRCRSEIVSPHVAHRQISEIAYDWGFINPAHFTRAFRQRFGLTPREARASIDGSERSERTLVDPRIGDRRYEQWIASLC